MGLTTRGQFPKALGCCLDVSRVQMRLGQSEGIGFIAETYPRNPARFEAGHLGVLAQRRL